jgi:hypothetical protein
MDVVLKDATPSGFKRLRIESMKVGEMRGAVRCLSFKCLYFYVLFSLVSLI